MARERRFFKLPSGSNPFEAAKGFLFAEGYQGMHGCEIRYFRGEFYVYQGTHYRKISRDDFQLEVLQFLQDQPNMIEKARSHFTREVVANVAALVRLPDQVEMPCFLDNPNTRHTNFIAMQNGIFSLDKFIRGKNPLTPHTSKFFCTTCLPFKYDKKAKCKIWEKFLSEALPDKDLRNLVQEWIGYGLTHDTTFHKFVLLVGAGANGKSVLCTVMRELYGHENISAVGLEQFNPSRTFVLHQLVGKTANIFEEMAELDKVAEDVLKNIVAGGTMAVEQKGLQPIIAKFTTKLTFATNVVPRFRDRTDGIWRRILFVPFRVQILDPRKQNRNYVNGAWWVNSGELSGIFNWALIGLIRLRTRGSFIEPKVSLEMKDEFKKEANPAANFLTENYEINQSGNLCSARLYADYADYVKSLGGKPLGNGLFTREVKNTFRQARLSKHPRATKRYGKAGSLPRKARVWENLRVKP